MKLCSLQQALGRAQACQGNRCPFWEESHALGPGCLLERFLPPADWTPELAERWLAVRRAVE